MVMMAMVLLPPAFLPNKTILLTMAPPGSARSATQLRISRQNTQLGAEAGFVILGGADVSIARTDHAEGIGVGNTLRLQRQTATQGIAQVTAFGLTW